MSVTPSASYSLTLRIELENEPGMLGEVTSAIGEAGGSVGAIDIVKAGSGKLVRDITVDAPSQEHWEPDHRGRARRSTASSCWTSPTAPSTCTRAARSRRRTSTR